MINEEIKCSFTEIPFKSSLSFEYLIGKIRDMSKEKGHPLSSSAGDILKKIGNVPELNSTITDDSIIEKHKGLIDEMMTFVFNPLKEDTEMATAMAPFRMMPVHFTRLFNKIIRGKHRNLELDGAVDKKNMLMAVIYQAYLIILEKFYNFRFKFVLPFTHKLTDEKEKSVRYFKLLVNPDFSEVKLHGKLDDLSPQELKTLFNNSSDLDYWNKKIPLEKFEFTGFLHFTFIDITQEHVISELKSTLLEMDSIITEDGFKRIRKKVRILMGIHDLEFGLAAFNEFDSNINQNVIWRTIIPQSELMCDEYIGTLYEEAYQNRRVMLTDDLKALKDDKAASIFLQKGIFSHAVVPLFLDNEIVGMMEFGAKKREQLNLLQVKRFHELFPVFAIALKRSRDEFTDRIRAIIQEECTAIHPVVEWRFRDAAAKMLNDNLKGSSSSMEPIVFNNVVPIYGAADIRNSSLERNKAIQADLTEHLGLARKLLNKGKQNKEMPLLNHLMYKIDKHVSTVKSGLKAGDEVSIIDFIQNKLEPVFTLMKNRDSSLAESIEKYFQKMDPELGVRYHKRKNFEESLTEINDHISEILDQEQEKAQAVFPHYYEKYRTDGIEYNAYIGQSLVKDLEYDVAYLSNLRIWQLLVMVKIARRIRGLQSTLTTPLDITQLVLVHSKPLSIAFRQDEKKFDVAGAYNIRYEITKKRIDKAVINGTTERVTQVGKIAIIYSQADEMEEYRKYIDYLVAERYLKNTVEDLELEDLKGASGLRALRVTVNFDTSSAIDEINISEIRKVFESH